MPFRKYSHWTKKFSSRWYWCSIAALTAGEAGLSPKRPRMGSPGRRNTNAQMMKVAPRMTGMVWSSRLPMYHHTVASWLERTSSRDHRDISSHSQDAGGSGCAAPSVFLLRTCSYVLLGEGVVLRLLLPGEHEALDVLAGHGRRVLVPQRQRGQILQQDRLRLGDQLVTSVALGRGGLGDELVELLVAVVTVVRAGAGGVDRSEVVEHGRVVRLPTGTERGLDGAVGDVLAELVKRGVDLRRGIDAQRVLDLVRHGLGELLVAGTVVVVRDLELAVPLADLVGCGPVGLGLGGVE